MRRKSDDDVEVALDSRNKELHRIAHHVRVMTSKCGG